MMPFGNLYCAGTTPALRYACNHLKEAGIHITDAPGWDTMHLLLDVPSFHPGLWTETSLCTLLSSLPSDITVWGGNLACPTFESYKTVDLLQDELYLQENADITADCTIPIAENVLNRPWNRSNALIIGWGRIGKSLYRKLKDLGCDVTVASRYSHQATDASSPKFCTLDSLEHIESFHLIVNTAPAHVLTLPNDIASVTIDLASVRGIDGDHVIWAKGLPGRYAPERSGKLIADTVLRLSKEVLS